MQPTEPPAPMPQNSHQPLNQPGDESSGDTLSQPQPAPTPLSPANPPQPAPSSDTIRKASINPFKHISRAIRQVFKVNFIASLSLFLISMVVLGLLIISFIVTAVGSVLTTTTSHHSMPVFETFIVSLVIVMVVGIIIAAYLYQAINRVLLCSLRNRKISISESLKFAAHRYPLSIKTSLYICGIVVLGIGIIAAAALVAPPLAFLFGLIGLVVVIIFALRLSFITYAIVDDEKPAGVKSAIKKSSAVWKRNGGAVILFWITIMLLEALVSAFAQSSTDVSTTTGNSPAAVNLGTAVVGLIIYSVIELVLLAGFADIYVEATSAAETKAVPPPLPNQPVAPSDVQFDGPHTTFAPPVQNDVSGVAGPTTGGVVQPVIAPAQQPTSPPTGTQPPDPGPPAGF